MGRVNTTQLSQFFPNLVGKPEVRPATGPGRVPADEGRAAARAYFSELASKFPMSMMIAAEFTQLTNPVPASIATVPAGQWLWHNLIEFDPWARLKQDIVVFGIWMDMLSTNPSPTTPATQAAWGEATGLGLGAAVVVGDRQLPGTGMGSSTFTTGVAQIAGIDSSVVAVYDSLDRRHFARSFPTGKLTTGWNKRGLNGAIVPFVRRITQGNVLRAAFVLNRADAIAAGNANKTIDGYVSLEIYFGLTRNPVDIND